MLDSSSQATMAGGQQGAWANLTKNKAETKRKQDGAPTARIMSVPENRKGQNCDFWTDNVFEEI